MEIKINGLSKKYGDFYALDNFNSTLSNGVYGLLGPNGAGKSTMIQIIVGLVKESKGSICFDGVDISKLGENYLSHIGFLPQYPQFYNNFSVYDFMYYMAVLKNVKKSAIDSEVNDLLNFVNMYEQRHKKISQLSGGMRQRLGIAQALLNNPDFIILDEPTAGLDPEERIRFRNLISQISNNKTVLLATHIVSDVELIAKEIILIKNGKNILQASPQELIDSINGKVWLVKIHKDIVYDYLQKYIVSNSRCIGDEYEIRIIADKKLENGIRVTPSLEDVYLYYFGEKANDDLDS